MNNSEKIKKEYEKINEYRKVLDRSNNLLNQIEKLDSSLAKAVLGLPPGIGLANGLQTTIDWFKDYCFNKN